MRSVYLAQEDHLLTEREQTLKITDGIKLNHFLKVLRMKVGESLLVFNSNGYYKEATIESIEKREIQISTRNLRLLETKHNVELAIAWLKKEAFEETLGIAVQLGIKRIHCLTSEFSQGPLDLSKERFERIIISSMEQSNFFYSPEIFYYNDLSDFTEQNSNIEKYVFTLPEGNESDLDKPSVIRTRCIYMIGPEGGFSSREIKDLLSKDVKIFHVPTAIMRAPVAVSCAMGYILAQT